MKPNYRRCVACRKVAPKSEFWRVVRVHSTQAVALDHGIGRSAYICPQTSCLQAVQRKNRLDRALKVAIPDLIYQTLWQRLTVGNDANPPCAATIGQMPSSTNLHST